ncbi:unnamed protein product [Closterium sp. NIES-64]|nr:unnamed protein product [Closterium sp. NIES-64]
MRVSGMISGGAGSGMMGGGTGSSMMGGGAGSAEELSLEQLMGVSRWCVLRAVEVEETARMAEREKILREEAREREEAITRLREEDRNTMRDMEKQVAVAVARAEAQEEELMDLQGDNARAREEVRELNDAAEELLALLRTIRKAWQEDVQLELQARRTERCKRARTSDGSAARMTGNGTAARLKHPYSGPVVLQTV